MLFREYWGRPQATADAFDSEGYFLTGDTVSLEGQPPYYRVRRSQQQQQQQQQRSSSNSKAAAAADLLTDGSLRCSWKSCW
jgi:non-ribosomal peptide synthetase component E (peptide arylation enzyme)